MSAPHFQANCPHTQHFPCQLSSAAIGASVGNKNIAASIEPGDNQHSFARPSLDLGIVECIMVDGLIVLAHGVLGFGNPVGLPSLLNYFNGVEEHLQQEGYQVFSPQVNPFGSIAQRGAELASAILRVLEDGQKAHIFAHSMGGLDARYALANVPGFVDRVATLVTIGTPHRGSPVADAIVQSTPLSAQLPSFLTEQLQRNAGALHDLTTDACAHFNETTVESAAIRRIAVAGDASQGGHELILFQVAALIGQLTGEVNDGVVTESSALREGYTHLDLWPADHAGEIGWSLHSLFPAQFTQPFLPPPAHLGWYDQIVAML
jgi:triacylglycerol lipase